MVKQRYYKLNNIIPLEVLNRLSLNECHRVYCLWGLLCNSEEVLDVGCGTGALLTDILGHLPVHIAAIDIDKKSIDYAQSVNKHANVDYIHSSVQELDSTIKYDVVICNHVLEHLDEPEDLLKAMKCLVKADGVLYVGVPNGFGSNEIESLAFRMAYKTKWGKSLYSLKKGTRDTLNNDSQHVQFFTHSAIKGLLAKSGWKVEYCVKDGLFGGMVTNRIMARIPLLEHWNLNIVCHLPYQVVNGWGFICTPIE